MTKNRYLVVAIRSDADDAIQTSCLNYIPAHDHVILLEADASRTNKALFFDAFSKILIIEGDFIVWRWNGTKAAAYPSFSE